MFLPKSDAKLLVKNLRVALQPVGAMVGEFSIPNNIIHSAEYKQIPNYEIQKNDACLAYLET